MTNKLPDRMRVESPQIDSINRTTQRISNWIHEDFREIVKPLQVLPSLPGVLKELQERLVEQFRINFSGQVAIEMKAHEANIMMAERKSRFLEEQTERKQRLLTEYSERIKSRYGRMSEDMAKEHNSFLNQLDSHAYRIVEEIYPDQIYAKFGLIPDAALALLVRHAMEASQARTASIADARDTTSDLMAEFIAERQDSYASLREIASDLGEGSYEIPYCYAVFEDSETGDEVLEIAFLGEDGRIHYDPELNARIQLAVGESQEVLTRTSLSPDVMNQVQEVLRDELDTPQEQVARFRQDHARIGS